MSSQTSQRAGSTSIAAAVVLILLFLALSPAAGAADEAALKRGHALAAHKCALCHAIGRDDERPHAIVIPFRELHTRFPIDMLLQAMESLVIAGHDEMPMFELSRDDMQALLAYIDSLAPGEPGYTRMKAR